MRQKKIYIRHLAAIVRALPITRSHLFCLCIAHEWEDIWYTIYAGIDVVSMDGPSFSDFEWQPARSSLASLGCHWKTTLLLIILLLLFLLLLWVFIARIISRFRVHWIRILPPTRGRRTLGSVGKVGQCNQDNQCLGMHWLLPALGCPCSDCCSLPVTWQSTHPHTHRKTVTETEMETDTLTPYPALPAVLTLRWQFLCSF